MRVIMIEATAEELRANRTIMDTLLDTISSFTEGFAGVKLDTATLGNIGSLVSDHLEDTPDADAADYNN